MNGPPLNLASLQKKNIIVIQQREILVLILGNETVFHMNNLHRSVKMVKNNGDYPASNVTWSLSFDGGTFFGVETSGVIESIPAGGTAEISSGFVLGLGPTVVTARAEIDQGSSDFREQGGVILLFFVRINPGGG